MKNISFILVLAGLFAFRPVEAQTTVQDTATKNFILKASIGGLQEVLAGKLAEQKATDSEIRSFGSRMVSDHSKADAQLMQLAKEKGYEKDMKIAGIAVPDMMLNEATGKEFDRVYVHMMVPDHRSAVNLFQRYALTGKDPEIKAFAQQTLPILKEHLAAILAIEDKMKALSAR
jgi:putative membrane protein